VRRELGKGKRELGKGKQEGGRTRVAGSMIEKDRREVEKVTAASNLGNRPKKRVNEERLPAMLYGLGCLRLCLGVCVKGHQEQT
jgi:hypothetical protein